MKLILLITSLCQCTRGDETIQYKQKQKLFILPFAILLTTSLLTPFIIKKGGEYNQIKLSGISSTIDNTKDLIEGLNRFIKTIKLVTQRISNIVGFKAVFLFIIVLFFGAGLSYLGIPRGKASFLSSLILADLIWFTWEKSFNPETYSYIFPILKTNLILLIPLFFIYLLNRFAPIISVRIIHRVLSVIKIPFINKGVIDNKKLIDMSERFQEISFQFQKSLFRDILHNRNDKIILSSATNKHIRELEEIIKGFHK